MTTTNFPTCAVAQFASAITTSVGRQYAKASPQQFPKSGKEHLK